MDESISCRLLDIYMDLSKETIQNPAALYILRNKIKSAINILRDYEKEAEKKKEEKK